MFLFYVSFERHIEPLIRSNHNNLYTFSDIKVHTNTLHIFACEVNLMSVRMWQGGGGRVLLLQTFTLLVPVKFKR